MRTDHDRAGTAQQARRHHLYGIAGALTALLLFVPPAAALSTAFGDNVTFSAYVEEAVLPGGTVFENTDPRIDIPIAGPLVTTELLHNPVAGVNFSGHSPSITKAFASSLAGSDGAGGVGVTATVFGNPNPDHLGSVGQQVAQSLWTQTFQFFGVQPATFSFKFDVPAIDVGLIGVSPSRSAPSATETASAIISLDSIITRANGDIVKGGSMQFGIRVSEEQVFLSAGNYANFVNNDIIAEGVDAVEIFQSYKWNGSIQNPIFSLDPVSGSKTLGTLYFGDTLAYTYTLTTAGTTLGGEHGYLAFIGDPFSATANGSGFDLLAVPVAAVVSEPPAAAALLVAMLATLIRRAQRRPCTGAPSSL